MSEFTSLGDLAQIVLRDVARNRADFYKREADKHMRRMMLSRDPIFVRRYVEATSKQEDAICEVARHV
jgi:hypothetical protein